MKHISKPQKFLYNTMVNPPASAEQFFPRQEKIPEGGRDQTDIFGLGWSLINSEIYSIQAVILPERNGGSFKLTIHTFQQKASEYKLLGLPQRK